MDHEDHLALIRAGVVPERDLGGRDPGGEPKVWADVGAGSGAFTLALADLLGPGAHIIATDRDPGALRSNAAAVEARFPDVGLTALLADFTTLLDLPALDGLIAANCLHFVSRDGQVAVVKALASHLRPGAPFIVVEYDADRGNPWVPHPFSSARWRDIATAAGLIETIEIGRVPSRFLGAIYAALSRRPKAETSRSMSAGSL